MFDINKLITIPPFSLKKKEKQKIMEDALFDLTYHHYKNCSKYVGCSASMNCTLFLVYFNYENKKIY